MCYPYLFIFMVVKEEVWHERNYQSLSGSKPKTETRIYLFLLAHENHKRKRGNKMAKSSQTAHKTGIIARLKKRVKKAIKGSVKTGAQTSRGLGGYKANVRKRKRALDEAGAPPTRKKRN